jgi:hypothetical protein
MLFSHEESEMTALAPLVAWAQKVDSERPKTRGQRHGDTDGTPRPTLCTDRAGEGSR